jgi:hypothetical protein
MEATSRPLDPFSQSVPMACFPAPYPPPPADPSSSLQRALATSFVSRVPPQDVRPLASYNPDVPSLTNLFGRMTTTTLETDSRNPRRQRVFGIPGSNKLKPLYPILSRTVANCTTEPRQASIEAAPLTTSTTTARRRKIAALPTRRGKTLTSSSSPVFDSGGATSYPIPRLYERSVEGTPQYHVPTSPQKIRLVSTHPSPYTPETSCFAAQKPSTPRQRKVHTLCRTLPQSQAILQNQILKPLATDGEIFCNVSRSPPLISDATSYFDSPPTSSDELDTPPSTPPSWHVLLASSSTESLVISSESDRIVSHKEPLSGAKLPYPRQRYRRLDFTKGGLGRDEQPLTFTFSV